MPHISNLSPHMFLWGSGKYIAVEADARQVVYKEIVVNADSKQVVHSSYQVLADSKQEVWINVEIKADTEQDIQDIRETLTDTKQVIYSQYEVLSDSKQLISEPYQISADTKHLISTVYAINGDSKHIITSAYSVQADIFNSIFSIFINEIDTQQMIHPNVEVLKTLVEIRTADGDTVAFLSPESDGIKECWINEELNGACTIEFELPLSSDKWQYLTDQYRIYAGDREFIILNPDALDRKRDGKKLTGSVRANEVWTLLGKKYETITNDPLRPNPPWGVVAILSGGLDLSGARHIVGTAEHALYALLEGTGWKVGTVDVGGIYDLETEKESILANINQVQEIWGGYLVWDSINKTVSLRSEEAWQNYTGFQVRYAKNLKGITRTDDYDIITRLYPFGENDLNIANVNDGVLCVENFDYTEDIYEGIWYDQNIHDQQELKLAGIKQLAKMCRPRHNYKTEILDLRELPDYKHEGFALGDMVDIIDEELGINNHSRIINHRYNLFQPWLCDLEIGDPIEKIAASVAQSIVMAKVLKSKISPNASFQNLLKGVINTVATEINGANGDYTLVDGVSSWFERDEEGVLTGNLVRITPKGLIISADGGQSWDLAINGEGVKASTIVGQLIAGGRLAIANENSSFLVDGEGVVIAGTALSITGGLPVSELAEGVLLENNLYNGVKIDSTSGFVATRTDGRVRTIVNATDGIKIQAYDGAWIDKLLADNQGNLVFAGKLQGATGEFSGSIKVGAGSNVSKIDSSGIYAGSDSFDTAPFRVSPQGGLVARSANIQGDIDCSSLRIVGTDILDGFNRINDEHLNIKASTINALNITAKSVSSDWVYAGRINANQINAGTITSIAIETKDSSNRSTGIWVNAGQTPESNAADLAFTYLNSHRLAFVGGNFYIPTGNTLTLGSTQSEYYRGSLTIGCNVNFTGNVQGLRAVAVFG